MYPGYRHEYWVKCKLLKEGWQVFKCARSAYVDFFCIKREDGELKIMLVEAKSTIKDEFKLNSARLKRQYKRLRKLSEDLKIKAVYYIRTKNKKFIIDVKDMSEVIK